MSERSAATVSSNAPVELSCWEEAVIKLQSEHPKLYKRLEEIRTEQPQTSPDSLAERLLAVIEAKRKVLENHELPLPFNIRNSDVKARIQRALDIIWKAVQVFKTAGDVATNIDPLHAGVAWSGVNIILQMALNGAEQNTAALEGLAQISPLVARYAKIEELYVKHRNDTKLDKAFKARLIDLYVAILRYQVSVAHHCQRNKLVQYARALPKMDDWKALLQEIMSKDAECRKFTELFDSEDQKLRHSELETMLQKLNIRTDAISRQMDGEHEQQRKMADLKEQQDILNWISTAAYRQDHRMIMENSKLDRDYANAGQWLFRHRDFATWSSRQSENPSTIWLCGPVGTGKSSLVCLVIEHCLRNIQSTDANKEQIAYFYCTKKQGQAEGSDPKTILRSLVRQLVWSADNLSILKPVKDIYDERQVSLTATTCITLLTKLVSARQDTRIIIDALDECSDPLELLSHLNEIAASANSNIRFFFSSRMNVDVREEFPQCAKVEISSRSYEDIEIYVKTEVKTRKRRLLHGKAPELEDRLIKILTHRAQGMFRWVQLQLEIFFSPKSPFRHSKDVTGRLDRLEEDAGAPELDAVYDEIYEMNVQQPQDRIYATRALKWIMCSQTSLKLADLAEAVSIDIEGNIDTEVDETYVMQICSNLLVTDAYNNVQFAHLSVREYLTSQKACSKIAAHAQAAKTCLAYVLHTDISERFGRYAVLYWPIHCRMSRELRQQDDSLQRLFNELMSADKLLDVFVIWKDCNPWLRFVMDFNMREKAHGCVCSPNSPWFTACVWGFPEVLRNLLYAKFDLERRNAEGHTGLLLASRYGHLDIVELLIENGVNIDAIDKYGYTALHTSIRYQQKDIVRLLLENGANCMNMIENPTYFNHIGLRSPQFNTFKFAGYNALHLVACTGDVEIMRLLLGKDVDVDIRTPTGMTALHLAARHGHTEQVRLLMEYGVCIDSKTRRGETAILLAAVHGQEETVRILMSQRTYIEDDKAVLKMAKLVRAIELNDELLVHQLLNGDQNNGLNGKICPISGAPFGSEALHLAISRGNRKIVTLLLENGADIDAEDEEGRRALHLAAYQRNTAMVTLLLEKGANIEAEDQKGQRALHLAATKRFDSKTVQLLLEKGADFKAVDNNGKTVLDVAVYHSNVEVVQSLLEKGAMPGAIYDRNEERKSKERRHDCHPSNDRRIPVERVSFRLQMSLLHAMRLKTWDNNIWDHCCRAITTKVARINEPFFSIPT